MSAAVSENDSNTEEPQAAPEYIRDTTVRMSLLQEGGYYVTVSVHGEGTLRVSAPEVHHYFSPELRKYLTRSQIYLLPDAPMWVVTASGETIILHPARLKAVEEANANDLRRLSMAARRARVIELAYDLAPDSWQYGVYRGAITNIAQTLRSLPRSHGLYVLGLDPNSSSRWIPHAAWEGFLGELQSKAAELQSVLQACDAQIALLRERWELVVEGITQRVGINGQNRARLAAAFPASFLGRVYPSISRTRISDPEVVDLAVARETAARAEAVRAQTDLLQAQVAQHDAHAAAAATARAAADEQVRAARAAAQQTQFLMDQVATILYDSLTDVLEGFQNPKATGPATRKFWNTFHQVQRLNEAGDEEVRELLADLKGYVEAVSDRQPTAADRHAAREAAAAAAQRAADALRPRAERFKRTLDETVRAVW